MIPFNNGGILWPATGTHNYGTIIKQITNPRSLFIPSARTNSGPLLQIEALGKLASASTAEGEAKNSAQVYGVDRHATVENL